MDNNKNEVNVVGANTVTIPEEIGIKVNQFTASIAFTGPTISLTFTTICMVFWASMMGFLGDGAGLTIGLVQLGVYGAYLSGAILLCKNGLDFNGNVFMIFASFFGGAGAMTNIGAALSAHFGIPFSGTAVGVVNLISGIFLLGILPVLAHAPWVDFAIFFFAGLGLVVLGLQTIGAFGSGATANAIATQVSAWSFFADGCVGMWSTIGTMLGFSGIKVPMGKPLFKVREQ